MTQSKTETVQTTYGDVEIDVVDCDSCGNRVAKDDTVEFTIGDREGRACSHCESEGPVSFPTRAVNYAEQLWHPVLIGISTVAAPLVALLMLIEYLDRDDTPAGVYVLGVVSGAVWAAAFYLLFGPF